MKKTDTAAKKPAAKKPAAPAAATPETAPDIALPRVADPTAHPPVASAKKPAPSAAKKPTAKPPAAGRAKKKPAKKTAPAAETPAVGPKKTKVLFVTAEAQPFAASGGLGEVAGSLPAALNALGDCDVRVIMPYYKNSIGGEWTSAFEFVGSTTVDLSWRRQYCGVFRLTRGGVTYYFLDNEFYFKRWGLYGEFDDGERFAFFSKAVLDVMHLIDFVPDILHCNDWQSALVPIYYKLYYMYREGYGGIKTIFTVHNIEYQGKFDCNCCEDLFGIPNRECGSIAHGQCINLMKGALDYSDAVTTVSPTYANEIMSDYFAHGLADVIGHNYYKLTGILNGIDTVSYDPATDSALFVNYDRDSLDKKRENKTALQSMLNLTVNPDVPMVAMISRLVTHKGVDLVKAAANGLIELGIQLVVLGTGNAEYEAYFSHLAAQYPSKVAAVIAFNKDLSRKIYAAADIFLMPSKSEPCGLSQMIASRYATVPVVRETGGLYDSIKDCNDGTMGNGYTFATYNAQDMQYAVERAVGLYRDYHDKWKGLMRRVIDEDFSWTRSAREYLALYNRLVGKA